MNIGPQHPSTHGVLRLVAILNGEIIQWISPELGYLHRGTEKLLECNYYSSSIGYFDRFDYVSTISQELLFVHALERLLCCFGTIYSSLFRTLFLELFRILNHCLAITTHAIDLGLFTTMLWTFEEREKLLCFIELVSGTRFHALILLIGRLRFDISLRFIDSLLFWLLYFIRRLKEIYIMLSINQLWRTRLFEIGIIDRNFALYFGLSGLLARSTFIYLDARLNDYEFYACLDFNVYLALNGDCLDRYFLRFNEMVESCRIIYSLLLFLFSSSFLFSLFSFDRAEGSIAEGSIAEGSYARLRRRRYREVTRGRWMRRLSSQPNLTFQRTVVPLIDASIDCTEPSEARLQALSPKALSPKALPNTALFRSSYSSTMEMLIYEFLITFPFLLSFLFVLKLSIESSKGIYSIFIMAFPYWTTNIISNDYLALSSINKFCRYINVGDLIAVLGSIDFVLGSIDL